MSRKLALFSQRAAAQCEPIVPLRVRATSLAEAHRALGRQHFYSERFKLARRHFFAALQIEPNDAEALFGLARAWEDDPYGSDERAFICYRRAVKLDQENAQFLASLGRSAIRITRDGVAKKAIAKAVRLAPGDSAVLAIVIDACREAGWSKRAWTYICRARFVAPQDAAIRELWNRVRYDRAAKQQTTPGESNERNVIPFLRIADWRLDAM